jgi:hypothetical protein
MPFTPWLAAAALWAPFAFGASTRAHHHFLHRLRAHHHAHSHPHRAPRAAPRFTGFVVAGPTSDFGAGTGDSEGTTADGGTTARPCIALRSSATLDHWFLLSVEGRTIRVIQCDWGPAEWTGRSIDLTGEAAAALGLDPTDYPTGTWGVAKELAGG